MQFGGCFSESCESSQNSRGLSTYMAPLFLTAKYYDIFNVGLGMGRLSQGKKEEQIEEFKEKESPY